MFTSIILVDPKFLQTKLYVIESFKRKTEAHTGSSFQFRVKAAANWT